MKLHRFFIDFDPSHSAVRITDKATAHQIKNVLRLTKGDEVILADGKNREAYAKVSKIHKDFAEFEIAEVKENKNEPARLVTLYLSILKRENFELAVQKAVEAGISEIVPVITTRTIKTGIKKERLESIIKEAAEQSGRGIIPILSDAISFEAALETAKKHDCVIFYDASGIPLPAKLKNDVGIFIGPEGGWSEEEVAAAKSLNWTIATLGSLTLRAETAAIVGTYIAAHL